MVMLAEYGKLSLADVLAPAMQLAEGYPIEARARRRDRAREGADQGVAVLGEALPDASGRGARGAAAGRDLPPAGSARDAARSSSRPSRRAHAAGKSRKEAILAAYDRFYKGDIAAGVRARLARAGRPRHDGGPREVEGRASRSRSTTTYKGIDVYKLDVWTQGPAMLRGAEPARADGPEGDGLQQRALHPRALPGDEPGVRRPRLLLRRPRLPAGGAAARAAVQGVRGGARARGSTGPRTTRTRSPATRTRSRAEKNPYLGAARRSGRATRPSRRRAAARRDFDGGLPRRHDVDRGGGRGGLGRLGDAVGRLESRSASPARPASA